MIALGRVGQIELLRRLYSEIMIPEAVFREVTEKDDAVKQAVMQNLAWIKVSHVSEKADKRMYQAKLHDGEVEVMILAQEITADLVILDDRAARKTAEYLGLPLTGTLGILLKSKEKGFLSRVMTVVEDMERTGIDYSDALKEMIRDIAGETTQ